MKIWLIILTILCLLSFWAVVNAYERIAGLTEVVNQHADAITQHAEIINENAALIDGIIDYINEG